MTASPLRRIVIVGGGVAALRAAERLAERGFTGLVDLVGAEAHLPYRRTALSDGVLTGQLTPRDLTLHGRLPSRTRQLWGVTAVRLDRTARRVELSNGRSLPYDGLIIATGLRARTLPALDALDPAVVHHLRTVDDAVTLRRRMRSARHVLVVGGGLVGTEAAAALRSHGLGVTLVEPEPVVLSQAAGPRVGAALTALHRQRRVDLRLGTVVTGVEWGTRGVVANLSDDTVVRADAALVAIGGLPEVDWLLGTGLDVERGVACEPTLHAIGADDIVACGDCARWPNLRFGGASVRVEQWVTSQLAAQHAADALLAGREGATAFTPIPWGWTEQWGVRVHMVGMPSFATEDRDAEGAPDALRGAITMHDELGRIVAGLSAERPGATLRLLAELERACPTPPDDAAARWRAATAAPAPVLPEHFGARPGAPAEPPLLRRFARTRARRARPTRSH